MMNEGFLVLFSQNNSLRVGLAGRPRAKESRALLFVKRIKNSHSSERLTNGP
jgi:hypothetical protein